MTIIAKSGKPVLSLQQVSIIIHSNLNNSFQSLFNSQLNTFLVHLKARSEEFIQTHASYSERGPRQKLSR